LIAAAVRRVCASESNTLPDDFQLSITTEEIGTEEFRVETNLSKLGLDESQQHSLVERALLQLGGLNKRVFEMDFHNAVTGFQEGEYDLFSGRIGFLLRNVSPSRFEETFDRVVEITDLPDFIPSIDRVNVNKLLNVLDSSECRDFREWTRTIGDATEAEIRDRFRGVRSRVGTVLGSGTGRALRFLTSAGVGLISGPLGIGLGLAAGAIDSFLLDRVLPSSGIWTFINRLYRRSSNANRMVESVLRFSAHAFAAPGN